MFCRKRATAFPDLSPKGNYIPETTVHLKKRFPQEGQFSKLNGRNQKRLQRKEKENQKILKRLETRLIKDNRTKRW